MRVTELIGREVMDTAKAHVVGSVSDVVVDPAARSIHALVLDGKDLPGPVVDWGDLAAVLGDVVTIDGSDGLRDPRDEAERQVVAGDVRLLGARVLSDAGDELGSLDDLMLDASSGSIDRLQIVGDDGEQELGGTALIGVGSYAVMVAADGDADALGVGSRSTRSKPSKSKRSKRSSGASRSGSDGEDLASMRRDDLYELAKDRDIAGRSSMTKAELVEALSD